MGRERHWPMPFSQEFRHGAFRKGHAIGVKGELKHTHFEKARFTVNLGTGPDIRGRHEHHKDNIGLQVHFRGHHEGFLLSSHHAGKWHDHETHKGAALKKGEEFYLRMEAEHNHWKVMLDGHHLGNVEYHVPLDKIRHIHVEGDVDLSRVALEGKYYMVPFEHPLPSLKHGHLIFIAGRPDRNAEKFDIELRHDKNNIPFCLSFRFKEGMVIRNTMKHDHWEHEEKHGPFPLRRDEDFDVMIECFSDEFDIIINGRSFCRYKHRLPLHEVKHLFIDGHVELRSLYI